MLRLNSLKVLIVPTPFIYKSFKTVQEDLYDFKNNLI